ncbi:MAG: GNAT family N-acyltransferase [Alphaproteobacteria bacterium]|nr:GNAT family N-acyltransferase [Alphaproteobacteria bacterium]
MDANVSKRPVTPIRSGSLEVRLAETPDERDAAQALRYRVFYEEMNARPSAEMAARQRDFDGFDEVAEHLLVLDQERGDGPESVIGTYRLILREAATKVGRFYTEDEYDISSLIAYDGEILELGRSCIDSGYRSRQTMSLLWKGLGAYVWHHDVELMFGCASLPGTDPQALAIPLAYLYHNHLAPPAIRPRAVPDRFVDMNLAPASEVKNRHGFSSLPPEITTLPPLIKGYLRVGGFVGDGAVVDYQFNTTDVCVIVKTSLLSAQYYKHFVDLGPTPRAPGSEPAAG